MPGGEGEFKSPSDTYGTPHLRIRRCVQFRSFVGVVVGDRELFPTVVSNTEGAKKSSAWSRPVWLPGRLVLINLVARPIDPAQVQGARRESSSGSAVLVDQPGTGRGALDRSGEFDHFGVMVVAGRSLVEASMLEIFGVGFDVAAKILVAAGDNPHRIRSEAAWAHLCGVAPIPASSGKVQRHRLNRGGNRQANSAIYRIMITRMSYDEATRAYITRRTAEGKTMGEIARMLKRYIAREVYKALPATIN